MKTALEQARSCMEEADERLQALVGSYEGSDSDSAFIVAAVKSLSLSIDYMLDHLESKEDKR